MGPSVNHLCNVSCILLPRTPQDDEILKSDMSHISWLNACKSSGITTQYAAMISVRRISYRVCRYWDK